MKQRDQRKREMGLASFIIAIGVAGSLLLLAALGYMVKITYTNELQAREIKGLKTQINLMELRLEELQHE